MGRAVTFALICVACSAPPRPPPVVKAPPPVEAHLAPPPLPATFPRLPRTFVPSSYRARVSIEDEIVGHMEITGDLAEPSSVIWLHGAGLVVQSATATRDGQVVTLDVAREAWPGSPAELLALQAHAPLAPGRWVIAID